MAWRKQRGGSDRNRPLRCYSNCLRNANVLSLPALRSLDDVELNRLTLLQRTEAVALNRGVMDENVLSGGAAQKSKTLGVVKPFHCSCFHDLVLFSIRCTAETQCRSCLRVVQYDQNKQEHQIGFYDLFECTIPHRYFGNSG